MRNDRCGAGGRLASALLVAGLAVLGCNGGEGVSPRDGSMPIGTGTAGSGGGGGGSGGATGGSGGGGGSVDGGVDAPPVFVPHVFIPGPYNRALVSGAVAATSAKYKVVATVGESPGGGNSVKKSAHYKFVGGLIGSTQR